MVDSGHVKKATIRGEAVDATDSDGHQVSAVTPSNQDELIKRLLAEGATVDVKPVGGNLALNVLFQLLPILLIAAIWFIFMRQMQGGARGAMGFGKSKAKLLT